jgi:uncharacterized protein (DUF885 family)
MTKLSAIFVLCFVISVGSSLRSAQAPAPSPAAFDKLVDEWFDSSYKYNPTTATADGFHQYDTKLEDFSQTSIKAQIVDLKSFLAKFQAFPTAGLSETSVADRDFLIARIQGTLLELETIQMWRKDPDNYINTATYGIFLLMKRTFAPQEERLRSLIAREKSIPKLLDEARANLTNPPRVYTEIAIEDMEGTVGFFESDVATAFPDVKDAKLLAEFKATNGAAIAALKKYQSFLKNDLLPKSNGDFRLGAENYHKKLLYDEMVDIPLDRLLQIGYDDLHRNQQRVKEVAASIDPYRSPLEILKDLQKDHPTADQLLPTFRSVLAGLTQFIQDKKIITIPSPVPPIVEETPPFQRALSSASMDTPGAYEKVAKEAYFNVTPVEPDWTPERAEQWLQAFNRGTVISTAIHEAYPGHYEQFLWVQDAPSKTRKLLYCSSNAEGWAHYTEQMMLDEGYGNGDPKLRLGQLLDALLRDARYIAGIEMHTGKMTLEQANQFFIDQAYQTPAVAHMESRRGTSDPTYLVYTLGKLQILKLREDYKQMKGDQFTLQEFHDRLMKQGGFPIFLIRKAMLGNDSPTL